MTLSQLIKQCKKNDRKAQFKLFEQYVDFVTNICERYSQDVPSAKDNAQKTFIKIFEKLDSFNPEKGTFKAWIKRIAVNECLQSLRKKNKLVLVKELVLEEKPVELQALDKSFTEELLIRLIEELPEGYRTVFLLSVVEEYSHKEIAAQLGISEASSRSQLFKAKRALNKRIEQLKNIRKIL